MRYGFPEAFERSHALWSFLSSWIIQCRKRGRARSNRIESEQNWLAERHRAPIKWHGQCCGGWPCWLSGRLQTSFWPLFGSEACPIPVLLIYKVLSMLDLQVHQNILQIVSWYLHGQALAILLYAPWWLRMVNCLFLFLRCGKVHLWRVAVGAVGLFYLREIGERISFIANLIALRQRHKGHFDPAILGTLLLKLCAYRIKRADPVLTPVAT